MSALLNQQSLSVFIGLGSGRAPYEDHMCGDHDGTELVAQEKSGTGTTFLARFRVYPCFSVFNAIVFSVVSSLCAIVDYAFVSLYWMISRPDECPSI